MICRYLGSTPSRPARPEAARRLISAVAEAIQHIASEPANWSTHPRPYPEVATYGFRWIKVHRYWIGYVPGEAPLITNVLDEAADIPSRIALNRKPSSDIR